MFRSRKFYVSLLGALAWSSTAADMIITIVESVSISTTQIPLLHIAAAASALNAASLCCIGFYVFQDVQRRDWYMERSVRTRKALVGVSIVQSTAALIVSLILIVSIRSRWNQIVSSSSSGAISNWDGAFAGHVVIWVISCISQLALYSSPFWRRHTPKLQPITVSGPRDSVMSEMRSAAPSRNMFAMKPAQPSSPLAALPSPTFSTRSSQSLRSFRESIRYAVRPVTSRTTLISRPSFNRDTRSIYSDAHSIDNVPHSDGFDSWDTSSVSNQARDAVMQAPSKGTPLDPIPGSRSVTPARALDGPFLPEIDEEFAEEELVGPRMIPDISRPPSPAVSEAHIHPLFRTESPIPPPEATPGTSIIASPLADQVITCPARPYQRMRSNSNLRNTGAMGPSPMTPAQSVRGRTVSPYAGSRTPSPPGREMTPPIPDFILNSSPRSSMSGSRKVSLRSSPDW